MIIVSTDKVLVEALSVMLAENGFKDIRICAALPEGYRYAVVDLGSVATDFRSENTLTVSADRKKGADILRPFSESEFSTALLLLANGKKEEIDQSHRHSRFVMGESGFTYKGKSVELSPNEMKVLALLYSREGECVESEEIRRALGCDEEQGSAVTVYITYLRKKLDFAFGERLIYNVRGRGYLLRLE